MPRGKKKNNDNIYNFINTEGKGYDKDLMLAYVISKPGGTLIDVLCQDTIERKMWICGKIRKRVWLNPDDILVISLRSFEATDKFCDFKYKLKPNEIKDFKRKNYLNFVTILDDEDDNDIEFDEDRRKKPKPTDSGMCVTQEDFITFDDSDEEDVFQKPLNQSGLKVEEKKEEEEDEEIDLDAI